MKTAAELLADWEEEDRVCGHLVNQIAVPIDVFRELVTTQQASEDVETRVELGVRYPDECPEAPHLNGRIVSMRAPRERAYQVEKYGAVEVQRTRTITPDRVTEWKPSAENELKR